MANLVEQITSTKYSSGIIKLQINTREKWCDVHQYNDYTYNIMWQAYQTNLIEQDISFNITQLQKEEGVKYISSHYVEKDQIVFYFIPYSLLGISLIEGKNTIDPNKTTVTIYKSE